MSGDPAPSGAARVLLVASCPDEEATDALGAAIGAVLAPGDLVCLHGQLGAGKTRLVRGIARGVGVDPRLVSSPTFVVVHEYPPLPTPRSSVTNPTRPGSPGLVHVDAYRLRGPDELDTLGWDRVTGGTGGRPAPPLVVEWPERVAACLPQPGGNALRMDVAIAVESPTSREVELRGSAAWTSRPGWSALARLGGVPAEARPCPICSKAVAPDAATAPFCSERCRMADLGRWFSGSYTVSRDMKPDDEGGGG
jgi:tRNA threonylcarbamoyladenosine biosynthesis protein TsaE